MAEVDRPLWAALRDEIGSLRADLQEMAALRWELARLEVDYPVLCLVVLGKKQLAAGGCRIHWLEIVD